MIATNKHEDYPFQSIGIFRMRKRFKGRALLADDPGLGKTRQALKASLPFRHKRPIVVVCPAGVKYQWESEVKSILGFNSWVLEGQTPPRRMPLQIPPVIIVNWEILQYWVRKLKQIRPSVLIGDEIHYAKNARAKRTRALCKMAKAIPHTYFLSGTPFENCPRELFVSLNILRPDIFPSFKPFGDRYCSPKFTPWGITYNGATRMHELHKLLKKHVMVRRTKDQVAKQLPPITRTVVPLAINRRKYEEMEENFVKWMFKHKPDKAYKAKEVTFLSKLNYSLQFTAELKLKSVMEWIDNFLETTDKKLVVFGHHRAFLEALHKRYPEISTLRYGGMGKKKKKLALDLFLKKKKVRLFFGGIMAAGTGLDKLQTVCSDIAIAEFIWIGLKLLQVEGRIHRLGQKNPVNAYYLVAKRTIESMLINSCHRKQKYFNSVIDNMEFENEFEIIKTFIEKIKYKRKAG